MSRTTRVSFAIGATWTAAAALAHAGHQLASSSGMDGGPLVPLGVLLTAVGITYRIVWRTAIYDRRLRDVERAIRELRSDLHALLQAEEDNEVDG